MKIAKCIIIIFLLSTMISCGKNGEISFMPEVDTPPNAIYPPAIEEPWTTGEIPSENIADPPDVSCEIEGSCLEDEEIAPSDGEDNDPPPDNIPEDPVPDDPEGNPPDDEAGDEELIWPEEGTNGPEQEPFCIGDDENVLRWWITYQLTGGILKDAELEFGELEVEAVEGGTKTTLRATLPDGNTTVFEMNKFVGTPARNDNIVTLLPDDFILRYYGLTYSDPILGDSKVSGKIKCSGSSTLDVESGVWHKDHMCKVFGGNANTLLFNYLGAGHAITLATQRHFKGRDSENPENYRFEDGNISINGENYHIVEDIDIISLQRCLKLAGTQ